MRASFFQIVRKSFLQRGSRRENASRFALFVGESAGQLEGDSSRVAGRLELGCDAHGGDALAGFGSAELVVDAERAGESFPHVGCAEGGGEGEQGR